MTHIAQFSAMNTNVNANNNVLKDFQVEVIFFDGGSEITYVQAHNEYEASEMAAALFYDVDYVMVYGM